MLPGMKIRHRPNLDAIRVATDTILVAMLVLAGILATAMLLRNTP